MGLVDYSDSDGSDNEPSQPIPKPTTKPANPSKPAFAKLVDRENPHKIRVNLPSTSKTKPAADEGDNDGPSSKRARTGGGGLSGFNAMLPAPKRTGPIRNNASGANAGGGIKKGLGRPLGVGVNLKTGAAPAFSRERAEPQPDLFADAEPIEDLPKPKPAEEQPAPPPVIEERPPQNIINEAQTVTKVGKPMMFRPLSVTSKKKKKAAPPSIPTPTPNESHKDASISQPAPPKTKVSLFSLATEQSSHTPSTTPYEPLLHKPPSPPAASEELDTPLADPTVSPPPASGQSLESIATTLNLPPSARRQLLGRHYNDPSAAEAAINIITYDTDAQYAENEAIRASGEMAQQRGPVRAVAGGKHSLKQLVANASVQKEALEEQFAEGKRNRKEAGSRYGW